MAKRRLRVSANQREQCGKSRFLNAFLPIFVVAALLVLGFGFFKNAYAPGERHSAVESAAVASAADISRIVVNTPECGFVSLSDFPPTGTATLAGDGFSLPVRSINTIIGTVRLDLIIADKLQQPLMEEFAEHDLEQSLRAKDKLVETIREAIKPGGMAKDMNGADVAPYKDAESEYKRVNAKYVPGSLKLSLGCIEGAPTVVPVPEPQQTAPVPLSLREGNYYKACVNIPYKKIDFVFGGVGDKVRVLDHNKWKERINSLPYQFPTIVKAEIFAGKKGGNNRRPVEVACAQPYSDEQNAPAAGALSISFPDGLVPEIKTPGDCYSQVQLNKTKDSTEVLSAQGGDYPIDPGSFLQSMNWPLTNAKSNEPAANIWRLALYDWIRTGRTGVNIDSVVNMQKIEFDSPKPSKIMWSAPPLPGRAAQSITPISNGIMHIFEFDNDGIVIYRSKSLTPYPLYVSSQDQMCGISKAALAYSDIGEQSIKVPAPPTKKRVGFKAAWDVYIRDEVRHPGTLKGGKHGGEPIAKPTLSSEIFIGPVVDEATSQPAAGTGTATGGTTAGGANGAVQPEGESEEQAPVATGRDNVGFPPLIAPQSDFAETMNPPPPFVKPMPFGSGSRPFYDENGSVGTAVDIRFRRQIDVTELNGFPSTGYLGTVGPDE